MKFSAFLIKNLSVICLGIQRYCKKNIKMAPKVSDFYDVNKGMVHRTAFFVNYLKCSKPKTLYRSAWYRDIVKRADDGDYITFEEACEIAAARKVSGIHSLELSIFKSSKRFLPTVPELETDPQVIAAAQILMRMRA